MKSYRIHRRTLTAAAAGLLALGAAVTLPPNSAFGQGVMPQPIPPDFDFPADQAHLLQLRNNQDVAGMRKHAWMVFAGMTQKAPGGEAIWETWHSSSEAFAPGPIVQGARKLQRNFVPPRQFRDAKGGPALQSAGQSLASFVLFSPEGFQHIRANELYKAAKLEAINNGFANTTPVADRHIKDFPAAAISLKAVWMVIKKDTITGLPIWDGVPTHAGQPSIPTDQWQRAVAVDPNRATIPAGETATVNVLGQPRPASRVVPLSSFYSFAISADNLASIRTALGDPDLAVGDHAALVGLHMTTKEIPDWVWATFWWHDQPGLAPFGGDQPAEVKDVWRNYRMDVAFSMDTPRESDQTPNAVFNPWLEARFPDGVNSNCMTCHQRAVWPPVDFLPVTRGAMPPNDPFFRQATKLDFLWSVAFESR